MVSTKTIAQVRASRRRMGAILPRKRYNSAGVGPAYDPDALRLVLHHGRVLPAPLGGAPVRGGCRGWKLRCGACDGGVHALDRARPGLDAPPPSAVRLPVGSGGGAVAVGTPCLPLRPARGGACHTRRFAGAG